MMKKNSNTLIVSILVLGWACVAQGDLIGRWRFDGDLTDSIGGNDGTIVGDATVGSDNGLQGGAAEFFGDDSIVIPTPPLSGTSWSLTWWAFSPAGSTNTGYMLSSGDPSGWEVIFFRWFAPETYAGGVTQNTNVSPRISLGEPGPYSRGQWHHHAVLHDGDTRTAYWYIDGVLWVDQNPANTNETTFTRFDDSLVVGDRKSGGRGLEGKIDDLQIYDTLLTEEDVAFLFDNPGAAYNPLLATDPVPGDGAADVLRDVTLAWQPGQSAATHDVYLGPSFEDVNDASRANPLDALVSRNQTEVTFDAGLLSLGQTYYWRVDEVNAAPDNTVVKGKVWSFAVEPVSYAIEGVIATSNGAPDAGSGPENAVNGSGLTADGQHSAESSDMWLASAPGDEPLTITFEFNRVYKMHEMRIWNYNVVFEILLGFGVKDATVETSTDGAAWVTLGDVTLAQATAKPDYATPTTVDLQGVPAQYVRLTVHSGYGAVGKFGLSEVRFMHIPAHARQPQPADEATDVAVSDTVLNWRAGREAVTHEVYLSTDPDALELIDTTTATTVEPGVLDLGATYYWKIDEVNEAEAVNIWEGNLWSFATQAYRVVDDFESYDDEDNRIYQNWIDGYGIDGNGSQVGHLDSPFAEQAIVKSGSQSMPLFYDNANAPMSEAELTVGQDWTAGGIQSLALWFQGDPTNTGGQLYVKINNTKIVYDGPAVNLTKASWNLWSIDLSTVGNVSNVGTLIIGVEGAGANGVVYIDDVRLYPEVLPYHKSADITAAGDIVQGVPNDGDWPDAETPELAVDDDVSTKYLHRKGGAMATGIQITPAAGSTVVTGLTLTTANDTPTRDPITFELSGSNAGIEGPYTLIASGDVVDFAGQADWPRFTKNETLITFDNNVAYTHYQIVFPTLRGESETLMQIAEIELIGTVAE